MATDLQTIDQPNTRTQFLPPELPERLAGLVASRLPEIAPEISDDEALAAERALSVWAGYPKGSTTRQINKMMAKLSLAYPNARLSMDEADARLELYGEMLADIDLDVLAEGFRAAVKSSKFFPSVSELRTLAMAQPATPRMQQQYRLRKLLEAHRAAPASPDPIATPEEIAAVRAELSEAALRLLDGTLDQAA